MMLAFYSLIGGAAIFGVTVYITSLMIYVLPFSYFMATGGWYGVAYGIAMFIAIEGTLKYRDKAYSNHANYGDKWWLDEHRHWSSHTADGHATRIAWRITWPFFGVMWYMMIIHETRPNGIGPLDPFYTILELF